MFMAAATSSLSSAHTGSAMPHSSTASMLNPRTIAGTSGNEFQWHPHCPHLRAASSDDLQLGGGCRARGSRASCYRDRRVEQTQAAQHRGLAAGLGEVEAAGALAQERHLLGLDRARAQAAGAQKLA